ncbi:MAG: response regulator transcription factor [Pseudomonadota bacterium]
MANSHIVLVYLHAYHGIKLSRVESGSPRCPISQLIGAMAISIMIGDPDVLVREGLKSMIGSCTDFNVCRETATVAETLLALREFTPDICILETVMGRNAAMQFLKDVKDLVGSVPVLVMGYRHEREFALRAHRAGAAGYLAKNCTTDQLIHALRTVATRRHYISETMRDVLVEYVANTRPKRLHDALSDMDFEILCLLAQSVPAPRIAAYCSLTESVVRNRKSKIMTLLGLRNDAEIVEYAVKRNLVDRPY